MPSVEKIEIRIGKPRAAGSVADRWQSSYAGIPGGTLLSGAARLGALAPAVQTLDETGYVLKIPRRGKTEPVTAIAMAPDSPIECVDLYVNGSGGPNVHRLTSWCPWLGTLSEDDVIRVVPVRNTPYLGWQNNADTATVLARTAFWDMTVEPDSQIAVGGGGNPADVPSVLIPVRMNLYRGGFPQQAGPRAPYHGELVYHTGNAGAGVPVLNQPEMMIVVDGRRRVRVMFGNDSAGGAVQGSAFVYGVEGYKSLVSDLSFQDDITEDRRIDAYNLDELLAPTQIGVDQLTPLIFDYTGNPYFAFYVGVAYTAATTRTNRKGHIAVHCWDD